MEYAPLPPDTHSSAWRVADIPAVRHGHDGHVAIGGHDGATFWLKWVNRPGAYPGSDIFVMAVLLIAETAHNRAFSTRNH
jgi:hypothetical protein